MSDFITPPPELMEEWLGLWPQDSLVAAAQWGADQELEACCEWLCTGYADIASRLRAARRPKPPQLKEQAQQALSRFDCNAHTNATEMMADFDTIRRALEALPND
jgi:hypothetical protein